MSRSRNMMFVIPMAFGALFSIVGCTGDDSDELDGNWVTETVFDGSPRSSSVCVTIGNQAYLGTGYDGDDYLKDFWRYDIQGGYWTQVADFPGSPRSAASAFAVGDAVFVGTGYDGEDELADFYRYDTTTNTWTRVADFQGTARRSAVGFNSATAGYLGSGFDGDNDKKDFWRYDPVNNQWTELFGFGGEKRREAITFTIGNKVYFGTGSSNNINKSDFYRFDLTTETWERLTDLDEDDDYFVMRSNAMAFTIGNYGYVTGGTAGSSTWEYDPANDTWTEKTLFEGAARQDGCSIYNGNRAFVVLGSYGSYYFDDMFEFKPLEEYDDED